MRKGVQGCDEALHVSYEVTALHEKIANTGGEKDLGVHSRLHVAHIRPSE